MKKFVCSVCGYVHTADELDAEFRCPVCKVPASKFVEQKGDMKLAAEHEFGVYEATVANNADISAEDLMKIIIAYEPVWAIGTGLTATNEQAEEVCKFIRDLIAKLYDASVADETTIQYGGSMNAGNAAELLAKPNIDGGLIGGASLKPEFGQIVNA